MRSRAGVGTWPRRLAPWAWSVRLRLAWQAAFTALFALLLLRSVDLNELRDAVEGIEAVWVGPALLLFTAAKYIDSWRWRYLLRGLGTALPQRVLFGAFLIGNMATNLLPLRLGDVAKIQVLANRYGASRAGLAASVFIVEASLDGLVFVLFLLTAFAFGEIGELAAVPQGAVVSLCTAPGFLDTSLAVITRPLRCSARAPGGRLPGCGGRGARPARPGCSGL